MNKHVLVSCAIAGIVTLLVAIFIGKGNSALVYESAIQVEGAVAQILPTSYSLGFNGTNQYATFINLPSSLRNVFTYEAWIKRTQDKNNFEVFLSDANSSYTAAMVTLFIDGGNQECPQGPTDEFAYYQIGGLQAQCSGIQAELNRWYHIAVSRDSSGTRRYFVDGILSNTQTNAAIANDSTGRLSLGRAGQANSEYFAGQIAEVRVSNNARYTNTFTRPTSQLTRDTTTYAYWRLDEGTGQILREASITTLNGYLGNSSTNTTGDALWVQDNPITPTNSTPLPTSSTIPSTTPQPTVIPTPTRTPTPVPTIAPTSTPAPTQPPVSGGFGTALRFFGTGINDIDRVKIKIDNPQNAADIGATDFTIEWWMNALASNNTPGGSCSTGNDGWITGNILFDRDIWGDGDYGDFGVSFHNGRVTFGTNNSSGGSTVCGSRNAMDGVWHHVAVTRRRSDGLMQIFIDGQLDSSRDGVDGDLSYRNSRSAQAINDPYLVIGAEKHDYDKNTYPSFNGTIDEVRISNNLRYTSNFIRPTAPFSSDANTALLYHFNEGSGTVAIDSSTNNISGTIKKGGTQQGPQYVSSF